MYTYTCTLASYTCVQVQKMYMFIGVKTILKCNNIDLIGQISMFTEYNLQNVGSFVCEVYFSTFLLQQIFFQYMLKTHNWRFSRHFIHIPYFLKLFVLLFYIYASTIMCWTYTRNQIYIKKKTFLNTENNVISNRIVQIKGLQKTYYYINLGK